MTDIEIYEGPLASDEIEIGLEPLTRLTKDFKLAAQRLTPGEARYMVDLYYQVQDFRIQSKNIIRSGDDSAEPNFFVDWVGANFKGVENRIKYAMQAYCETRQPGRWAMAQYGCGPISAANLLANTDIEQMPYASSLWSFAGLNPTVEFLGSARSEAAVKAFFPGRGAKSRLIPEEVAAFARSINRKYETILRFATSESGVVTLESLWKSAARRPYSMRVKKMVFTLGESIVKVGKGLYNETYAKEKALQWERNLAGANVTTATSQLAAKAYGKDTDAYKWLSGVYLPKPGAMWTGRSELLMKDLDDTGAKTESGLPMLPPAQIHARARRKAVKLFFAHFWEQLWRERWGTEPPKPWAIAHGGHDGYIAPMVVE